MTRYALLVLSFIATSYIMAEYIAVNAKSVCAAGYDRPVGDPNQSRSVVLAKHAIVATSHPLAAETGLDVLKAGGNAADGKLGKRAVVGAADEEAVFVQVAAEDDGPMAAKQFQ